MPHQPYKRIVAGADTAILFIHGIVGTPDQFLPLMPLVPDNWSCVNLLLPGHGGSVSDFSHSSMAAWRRYVADEVAALSAHHRRILLAGHSMGTLFCIDEATKHSERIQGLFLLACPLYPQLTLLAAKQSAYRGAAKLIGPHITPAASGPHGNCGNTSAGSPGIWSCSPQPNRGGSRSGRSPSPPSPYNRPETNWWPGAPNRYCGRPPPWRSTCCPPPATFTIQPRI